MELFDHCKTCGPFIVLEVFPHCPGCPHLVMLVFIPRAICYYLFMWSFSKFNGVNVILPICVDPEASIWSECSLISPFGDCTAVSV
jgi:hypothetical protein